MDVPDKTPDHSILEWKLAVMNEGPNDEPAFETQFKGNKRYDTSKLTTEFLNSEDCVKRISETVNRIENELSPNRCINEAYGAFNNFLMNEMDLAGLTVTSPTKYECKSKQSKAKTFVKPYWSDLLQQKWDAASKKEKLWLKCSDHTNIKRKLKQEYCIARNDFDKHLRKAKRTYQNTLQMDLLTELEKPNSRDFWKQIGKIGISNDRRDQIPWEVIDDTGEVITDKECVLQKWKTDYQTLFNDQTDSMLYDECHLDRIKKGEISSDPELVDTSCLNEPITRCEVEKAVSRLKLRKAAGIDNIPAETANGMVFVLTDLALNQDKQEILNQEIQQVLGNQQTVTKEHLSKMSYLKACVKESQRKTFPILFGPSRLTENNVVVGGYQIPKNMLVVLNNMCMCNDERFYPNPKEHIPERWMRKYKNETIAKGKDYPFGFKPFGFGPRSCVGQRFAENEIYIGVTKVFIYISAAQ
ncbi:CYP49A [Mytilus coruscus]|uniref:CYP49A n=1 Tax=Mytilus coruscus TaxID=42192 RepID=A0A6J8CV60_MYTCO|nr:CYP49A [Mytilus coruscus]